MGSLNVWSLDGPAIRNANLGDSRESIRSEGRKWGVRSVVVGFGVFGAPRFSVQRSETPIFKGFGDLWTENRGAPKTPNSTATDLTPHLRPSDSQKKKLFS